MSDVKIVLLDLGGVVLELDWLRVSQAMNYNSIKENKTLSELIGSWDMYDLYERGKLSKKQFFGLLKKRIAYSGDLSQLITGWNSLIVGPVQGIESVLRSLPEGVPLYGLTNTNDAHLQYIFENFQVVKRFSKIFSSFDLQLRKPEKEIFQAVLAELGVDPRCVLFVDDSRKNLKAAQEEGIHAELCLNSSKRLQEIFLDYGIIV